MSAVAAVGRYFLDAETQASLLAESQRRRAELAARREQSKLVEHRFVERRINAERRILDNRRQMMPVLDEADRRASERRFDARAEPVIDFWKL